MIFKILLFLFFFWVVYCVGRVNLLKKTMALEKKKRERLEKNYLETLEDVRLFLESDLDQKRILPDLVNLLTSLSNEFSKNNLERLEDLKKEKNNIQIDALIEEQISISKKIILAKKIELELSGKLKKINSSFWLDPLNSGK